MLDGASGRLADRRIRLGGHRAARRFHRQQGYDRLRRSPAARFISREVETRIGRRSWAATSTTVRSSRSMSSAASWLSPIPNPEPAPAAQVQKERRRRWKRPATPSRPRSSPERPNEKEGHHDASNAVGDWRGLRFGQLRHSSSASCSGAAGLTLTTLVLIFGAFALVDVCSRWATPSPGQGNRMGLVWMILMASRDRRRCR